MSKNDGSQNILQNGLLPFIVATYAGNPTTIRRNRDYAQTLDLIKAAFEELQSIPSGRVRIAAKFPGFDYDIRVTQDLWPELMPSLKEISVTTAVSRVSQPAAVQVRSKGPQTPHNCELSPEDAFNAFLSLLVKKPVIYLFPAVPTANVRVELSLVEVWNFSTLYPPTPICQTVDARESVTWTVDAKPDGTLLDSMTNREVSYLFWEAHTKPILPLSPACSRPSSPAQEAAEKFNPARPSISPSNSVVFPLEKVTGYIDDVLIALGLHTEARCSFITYWLPDLQHHKHIALRFLPQAEYEVAAPMSVTPAPDVTTRVFMLFRGVEEAELQLWGAAQAKATQDPSIWREVVGVDLGKAQDVGLFRVLEWGGMEVK